MSSTSMLQVMEFIQYVLIQTSFFIFGTVGTVARISFLHHSLMLTLSWAHSEECTSFCASNMDGLERNPLQQQ